MRGITVVVFGLVVVVSVALLLNGLANTPTCDQKAMRAQAEATRLAIDNEKALVDLQVAQGAASARVAALQTWFMGLAIAGVMFLVLLALVIPFWTYNRATMAYAHGGLYPVVVKRGLRGVTIYDANRIPGVNPQVTGQAQAVQLAAAIAQGDGLTAGERSAAMQGIGKVFLPEPRGEALLDPPLIRSDLTLSHVRRLLLEDGQNDDDA